MERLAGAYIAAMDEFFSRSRSAERHRQEEEHAALVLQACWRGVLQRKEIQNLSQVALTIQRCWRGHKGRRRFAAARAAHNKQLREAYFAHQATIIQSCWRGYFSRSRVHDFHRRQAYLASVAAANAAVRADMQLQLQQALQHEQRQQEQAAKQHFHSQVGKLHHLASTACTPGIFNPPAAAVAGGTGGPVVAGLPLEQHLRAASREQASAAVKKQQQTLRNAAAAASFAWPAGSPASSQQAGTGWTAGTKAAAAAASPTGTVAGIRACSPAGASRASIGSHQLQGTFHSGSSGPLIASPKLSTRLIAAVDDAFAAAATPNSNDGAFNPGLTLQQSADYNAVRQSGELERRINRGVMLATHGGQPFLVSPKITDRRAQASSPDAAAAAAAAGTAGPGAATVMPAVAGVTVGKPHWQQGSFSGGFFSKHLKQHY